MNDFLVYPATYNTIAYVYMERERIQTDPTYQRQSGVWSREKRQLLLDSILNGFDLPKLYLHEFKPFKEIQGKRYRYAIIDGKQRLEAIWAFLDGGFALNKDFEYFADPEIKAGGMTYGELGKHYPALKSQFDASQLPIMWILTEDVELIEDMFSRLNEAVPLNAPEKRNALGGPLPPVIRRLTQHHRIFTRNLPFKNARYRYLDLAAKFLYITKRDAVVNTKKNELDEFVKHFARQPEDEGARQAADLEEATTTILDQMADRFTEMDELLRNVGMILLYFQLFRIAHRQGHVGAVERQSLAQFEKLRQQNREAVAEDLANADAALIEFEEHNQTPNDAYAIGARLWTLTEKLQLHLDLSDVPRPRA